MQKPETIRIEVGHVTAMCRDDVRNFEPVPDPAGQNTGGQDEMRMAKIKMMLRQEVFQKKPCILNIRILFIGLAHVDMLPHTFDPDDIDPIKRFALREAFEVHRDHRDMMTELHISFADLMRYRAGAATQGRIFKVEDKYAHPGLYQAQRLDLIPNIYKKL